MEQWCCSEKCNFNTKKIIVNVLTSGKWVFLLKKIITLNF